MKLFPSALVFVAAVCSVFFATTLNPANAPRAVPVVWHVSTVGEDLFTCGPVYAPCKTIDYTVNSRDVVAGDTVQVHAGTHVYTSSIILGKSGAAGAPIVLTGALDGPARIEYTYADLDTVNPATDACDNTSITSPTFNRAIKVGAGRDHWVIRDLEIVGGIVVQGSGVAVPQSEEQDPHDNTLPGQGTYDPIAADALYDQLGIDPSEGIQILHNDLSWIGIYLWAADKAVVDSNTVHDINCWSGGGVRAVKFTHKALIRSNTIQDIAGPANHYMGEGIRLGSGSSYNTVESNSIQRLGGNRTRSGGRGITTDVHSNWNVLQRNTVIAADYGVSEQEGSRGNRWVFNQVGSSRTTNYHFGYGQVGESHWPDSYALVECNASTGAPTDLLIQSIKGYTFRKNQFALVSLTDSWKKQWPKNGNTWDGSAKPPLNKPAINSTASYAQCN